MKLFEPLHYTDILPASLHSEAEKLLKFLTNFPYEKPKKCPKCNNPKFHKNGLHSTCKKLPSYKCPKCGKSFTSITNTVFSNSHNLHLWYAIAYLWLSGFTNQQIIKRFNITESTVVHYITGIKQITKEQFPELYSCSAIHTNKLNKPPPIKVQEEFEIFIKWLTTIIEKQAAACPRCGKVSNKKVSEHSHRPSFVCSTCHSKFSLLNKTYLKNLRHIDLWVSFNRLLIKGKVLTHIKNELGLDITCISKWRDQFLKQMQALELIELTSWILWQRNLYLPNNLPKANTKSV